MSYVITGSPGTGKHTIGKMLAEKLDLEITDINLLAKESKLCKEIDGVLEVDTKELSKIMENASGIIIGHLAPYVVKKAESVIVLRKNPYELEKVYRQRNYSKEKTLENIQAEILGIIAYDALQKFPDLIQIDATNQDPEKVLSLVENRLNHTVDWLQLVSEKDDLGKFFPNERDKVL